MIKPLVLAATLLAALSAAQAEPVTYNVDPTHAAVFWQMSHFGTSTNHGRFGIKSGTVQIDRAAKAGKVDITIDMSTIDTGVKALDVHLSGKDFFRVAEFPTGSFVADQVSFDGDKVSSVSGQLTLLGKALPVTLKAVHFNCYTNPMFKREVCGGDFATTIKRSDWGLSYGMAYGFPDEVPLNIQIEAIKQ
jgi:polyisoprenoid-binding protein YceI